MPDSTLVCLSTNYAPLYSEKDRASGGDSERVTLRAHGVSGGLYSRFARLKYYLSCSRDGLEATYRQRDGNYFMTHRRETWNIASGAAYQYRNLLVGAGLGRHRPEAMEREHLQDIRDDPENYLRRGPWQLSLDVKVDFAKAAARLSLFSGPVTSSVSKLVTSDETSCRSFPLSIIRHGADAGIDVRTGMLSASTTFGIDYFENADLQTAPNGMPQDVAISNYRLTHHGTARPPFTDSLWWSLSGSIAGGWVASYNFDRERFTFFKSEAVRFHSVHAGLGAKLPGSMTGGISQTIFNGTSPSGFLRLSALSAWSAFTSPDYRYADAEATYRETGGFVNRKCVLSSFEIVPQLYTSYVAAKMGLSTSHKEIVVLVPVYVDTIDRKILDTRLMLFEPSLSVLVKIGRIRITGSVHQMLPVFFTDDPKSDQPAQPGQQSTSDNIVSGGTRLFLSAIWQVPWHGRFANRPN